MNKELSEEARFEARWPAILTILAAVVLLGMLPGRIRLVPVGVPFLLAIVVVVPMAAVGLTAASARWLRVERTTVLLFVAVAGAGDLANLATLIRAMVGRSAEIPGMQLLSSSIAVWSTNVIVFSLLYWQMDRGGPEARTNNANIRPDWLFPQTDAPEDAPPDWRPTYVDYLFLAFTTATAFSPTEAMPMTSRAKMLMMLQSAISLVTIVVVASRAINILGG